jgi:glycosyltransferase involved in cell wall biosynthesis
MVISIIIPTYNEALVIKKTIEHLQKHLLNKDYEIIISDAGSTDETVQIAQN